MARLTRPPKLIGYFFGAPGTPLRWRRPGVVALSVLTAASLVLTGAVAHEREDVELTITSSGDLRAQRLASGDSHHRVGVALENRGRERVHLHLALSAPGVLATLRPEELVLGPGEHRRLVLSVTAQGIEAGHVVNAQLTARAEGTPPVFVEQTVTLGAPEAAGR
jgi:hypothetical protein